MTDLGLILKQGLICKIVYRYQIKNTEFFFESCIFHLLKTFYSPLSFYLSMTVNCSATSLLIFFAKSSIRMDP